MKAVISNGSYKFHLASLASELAKTGNLAAFFTAGYPKGWMAELLSHVPVGSVQRLLSRREDIPENLVCSFNSSELFFKSGDLLFQRLSKELQYKAHICGFESYAQSAAKQLKKLDFDIYHYRNCYGLHSAKVAAEMGKPVLCDHSIAHPDAITYVAHGNSPVLPSVIPPQKLNLMESYYLKDLKLADIVLVNSDFVKDTFMACGFPSHKVRVVYWGVDTQFLKASDKALSTAGFRKPAKHILFSGLFERRKGAIQLLEALELLAHRDWRLTLAGGIDPALQSLLNDFSNRFPGRLNNLGILPRNELARIMAQHAIFIFPSLMEGSARVVFEALACGCFVLTTPNSGSIVEEGIHGALAETGSSKSLAFRLAEVWDGKYDYETIGKANQQIIRDAYRQEQYASNVRKVYNSL